MSTLFVAFWLVFPRFSYIPPVVTPVLAYPKLSHRNLEPCPIKISATLGLLKLNKQGISLYLKLTFRAIWKLGNRLVQTRLNLFPTAVSSALWSTTRFWRQVGWVFFHFPQNYFLARSFSPVLNMTSEPTSLPHAVRTSLYKPFTPTKKLGWTHIHKCH